jgi:hypothetical protein
LKLMFLGIAPRYGLGMRLSVPVPRVRPCCGGKRLRADPGSFGFC